MRRSIQPKGDGPGIPAPEDLVATVDLETSEQLLDALTPHREGLLWRKRGSDLEWMFRGQADAAWGLRPAAFRDGRGARMRPLNPLPLPPTASGLSHRMLEQEAVGRFARLADAAGYPLPDDGPFIRDRPRDPAELTAAGFPAREVRGLYALAQHHRVPTRLLDWSIRPLVAAYFAAVEIAQLLSDASRRIDRDPYGALPERVAVWGASQRFLRTFVQGGVSVVTASAFAIPNLRAQQARFTLVTSGEAHPSRPEELPDLDELLCSWEYERSVLELDRPMLVRFTLPTAQAPRLLAALAAAGVTAATVFASLDAAYRAIVEETWYA